MSLNSHPNALGGGAGGGGAGSVTVVSSGTLTSTALVTGGGGQDIQTPSATTTLDASGNVSGVGTLTSTGASINTANALGAFAINTGKGVNTKTIATEQTFTFSGAPATDTWFSLFVVNSDTSAHTLTIPSCFSVAQNATITTVVIAASGQLLLTWRYDGAAYEVFGDATNVFGNTVNYPLTVYGAGTAYSLTNTAAAIDFGTTDPTKVLDKAGTYMIWGQVNLAYTAATVVAETATIKVRRTNNTAADLSAVVVLDLPVATTLTNTYGIFSIPPFVYTTTATNDSISLFANVSAGLGAGTIDATAIGTSLVCLKIY